MSEDNSDQSGHERIGLNATEATDAYTNMVPTVGHELPDHGFLRSQVVAMFHEYMSEYMSTHSSPPTVPAAVPIPSPAPRISTPGGGAGAMHVRMPVTPALSRVSDLPSHFVVFEALFAEEGISPESMKVKIALAKSFDSFPKLQEMVYSLISLSFMEIKEHCIRCFASPSLIRDELDARLTKLQFNRDTICNDLRGLYQFYLKANASSPMPEETFVTKAFSSLPGSYMVDLIRAVQERYPRRIWKSLPTLELCELLDDVCFVRGQMDVTLPSRKGHNDKVRRTQARSPTAKPNQSAGSKPRSEWMSQLVDKHEFVYYVNEYTQDQLAQVLKHVVQSYKMKRRDGTGHYYVIAFRDQATANDALQNLPVSSYRRVQKN
jgi:hypothetical protein